MARIDVFCKLCVHLVRVSALHVGKKTACPACGGELAVPPARPEAPPELGALLAETRRLPFLWQRVRVHEGGVEVAGERVLWRDAVSLELNGRSLHVFARGRKLLVLGRMLRGDETIEKAIASGRRFVSTKRIA